MFTCFLQKKQNALRFFLHDEILKTFQLTDGNIELQPEEICFEPKETLYIRLQANWEARGLCMSLTWQNKFNFYPSTSCMTCNVFMLPKSFMCRA